MTAPESRSAAFTAVIHGSVQGVGFRYYTRSTAHRLGVYGYVQNQADGTVKVVCEGRRAAVTRMAEWLEIGPPSARVLRVDMQWHHQLRGYSTFSVEF